MKHKYRILLMLITFLVVGRGNAQNTQDSLPKLVVIHQVQQGKIILRWAPSTASAWYTSNKYGYKIERIANRSKSEDWNENITIQPKILPWSKDRWHKDSLSTYDDYCLIAAEILYGKKSEKAKNGKILQQADDFNNRYVYAMMAADFSSQAANALGVRYEDKDIKPGYTYIYKITSLTPDSVYQIKSAMVIAYSDLIDTLYAPEIHHIESGDSILHVLWEKKLDGEVPYPAFYVEGTTDGKTYKRLNDKPFISDNPFGPQFDQFHIYSDSIPENYKPFGYRIIGVSPFGELSPPSKTIFSYGRDLTPPSVPAQVSSTQLPNNTIVIKWNYSDEEAKGLKGFYVGRSPRVLDSFENIAPRILPPSTRSFTDENPDLNRPNFYIVTAIDTATNYAISQSHYAHMIDSVAPAIPSGLKGQAFVNRQVKLTWNANNEKDLLGYTVHYSNHPDHVFSCITNKPIKSNSFTDTVMIKTLTENLYYKVVAIDKNFNYSEFSEVIKVSIPDIVPPSAALTRDYKKEDDRNIIYWINSTSSDVEKHILYRKDSINAKWINIFETKNENSFYDKNIQPDHTYFYKVHAYDEVSNESIDAPVIEIVRGPKTTNMKDIRLQATKMADKVVLSWNSIDKFKYFTLYKTNKEGRFVTLGKTDKTKFETDYENEKVTYALRITHSNGQVSDYSMPSKIEKK